jgi:hypothetical protein
MDPEVAAAKDAWIAAVARTKTALAVLDGLRANAANRNGFGMLDHDLPHVAPAVAEARAAMDAQHRLDLELARQRAARRASRAA